MERGVGRRDSACATPNVKLFVHTIYCVMFLQGFVWSKHHFMASFYPDIKTVKGVVLCMYLKCSTDYINSKYIWVHGSNSLGFFCC